VISAASPEFSFVGLAGAVISTLFTVVLAAAFILTIVVPISKFTSGLDVLF
jgi:hypothetical protein